MMLLSFSANCYFFPSFQHNLVSYMQLFIFNIVHLPSNHLSLLFTFASVGESRGYLFAFSVSKLLKERAAVLSLLSCSAGLKSPYSDIYSAPRHPSFQINIQHKCIFNKCLTIKLLSKPFLMMVQIVGFGFVKLMLFTKILDSFITPNVISC